MPIKVLCPRCGRSLTVPDNEGGLAALCNACGQRLVIPMAEPPPPIDPLVVEDLGNREWADKVIRPATPELRRDEPPVIQSLVGSGSGGSHGFNWRILVVGIVGLGVIVGGVIAVNAKRQSGREAERRAAVAVAGKAKGSVTPKVIRKVVKPAASEPVSARAWDQGATRPAVMAKATTQPLISAEAVGSLENAVARVMSASPRMATTLPIPPERHEPVITLHVSRQAVQVDPVNDERIGAAIEKGANWLLGQFDETHRIRSEPGHQNGMDALCVYALLQCGQAVKDERLDIRRDNLKALLTRLDALKIEDRVETYGLGLRATALALHNRKEDRARLVADVGWLISSQKAGAYGYNRSGALAGGWDNSNSQYGLLGVWSGAEAAVEVPQSYWMAVQKHWITSQDPSGTWGYHGGGDSLSMTLAGVASLFVAHDYLEPAQFSQDVGRAPFSPPLAKALRWMEQGDNVLAESRWSGYTLYGIERVGLASGFKYFGTHDWYRELGRRVLDLQNADGSWGDLAETSYALLFLARGRHPILMNKLRFDGYWANRPRDVANLSRFASHELERPLNWQVVSVDHDWTGWMDSPVLYLASHREVKLSRTQIGRIRSFIEAGGLLYTQSDGGNIAFDVSLQKLVKELFPAYRLEDVPADHPIYSMLYTLEPRPALKMVSNGVRALMIHSSADLAMHWQQRATKTHTASFQFGVNLFLYAAGKSDWRNRLVTLVIAEPAAVHGGTIRLARLKDKGAWNPEPAAWPRFARWFAAQTDCGVELAGVEMAELKREGTPLAHLTGVGAFAASSDEVEAVRRYVDEGGTLLIDCAGGDYVFSQSAAALLGRAFPDASLRTLPGSHPMLAASSPGMEDVSGSPVLRPWALSRLGAGAGMLEGFEHGMGRVFYTSVDITSGLLGTNTWGIAGYEPAYAQALVKNLILWTANK